MPDDSGSERQAPPCGRAVTYPSLPKPSGPSANPSTIPIMIVAGEASGEKHGAALARALRRLNPDIQLQLFGSGGDEMRAAGVETLVDARDVAIIGVLEIIGALRRLYRAQRTLLAAAQQRRPGVVVLIDWPDFNLRLARKLHRRGFKVVYYISPQVWAWRGYRVRAIRRDVDRMLVILPFEKEFFAKAGVEADYVGHPLLERVNEPTTREEFAARHELDPRRPIVALLPGSRRKEVHYHLPAMLDAARIMRDSTFRADPGPAAIDTVKETVHEDSDARATTGAVVSPASPSDRIQFVVPLASTIARDRVEPAVEEASAASGLDVKVVEGDSHNVLSNSLFAVVASGTATVEAALAGTPMVIVYRASELNWRLLRPLIKLDTFGMVNLIAGRKIVPELIQHQVTGERIATEAFAILSDPLIVSEMRSNLGVVRDRLAAGGGSASKRAAQLIMEMIDLSH
jgi:lipid-A-disaccharide synthase